MDRMGEQGFACARFTQEHHRHVGFGSERGQLQTTRHGGVARREVFEPQSGWWFLH